MNYTLKDLQASVARLIEQQGEDSVCAAWIYTGEDVVKYDDVQQPTLRNEVLKELRDEVIYSLRGHDYIHQVIDEAIEQEIAFKTANIDDI